MAECPNCNNKLAFFKAGFAPSSRSIIKCKSCETFIQPEHTSSGISWIIILILAVVLFLIPSEKLGIPTAIKSSLEVSGVGLVFLVAIYQYRTVKYKIAKVIEPNVNADQQQVMKGYEQATIDRLTKKYEPKTDIELERILENPEMVPEAHFVAKQLIAARRAGDSLG